MNTIAKQDRTWDIQNISNITENMSNSGVLETARIAVSDVPAEETITMLQALTEAWTEESKVTKILGKDRETWIARFEKRPAGKGKTVVAGRHTAIACEMVSIESGKEHTVKTVQVAPEKWRTFSLRENVAKLINSKLTSSDSLKAVASLITDGIIQKESEVQALGYKRGTAQKLHKLALLVTKGADLDKVVGMDIKKAKDALAHIEKGMSVGEAIALVPAREKAIKVMSKGNLETLAKETSNPLVRALLEAIITDSGIGARKAIASL